MRAVVYKEPCTMAVEQVDNPRIENPRDAVVKITSAAICGSDLHMYEGRTGAKPGTVFGHENMGVVEEVRLMAVLSASLKGPARSIASTATPGAWSWPSPASSSATASRWKRRRMPTSTSIRAATSTPRSSSSPR